MNGQKTQCLVWTRIKFHLSNKNVALCMQKMRKYFQFPISMYRMFPFLSYVTPVTPASACVQIFLFLAYFCYKLKQNIFHVNSSDFQSRITVQDPISSLGVNTPTTISVRLHNNGRKYPVLSRNCILYFLPFCLLQIL